MHTQWTESVSTCSDISHCVTSLTVAMMSCSSCYHSNIGFDTGSRGPRSASEPGTFREVSGLAWIAGPAVERCCMVEFDHRPWSLYASAVCSRELEADVPVLFSAGFILDKIDEELC